MHHESENRRMGKCARNCARNCAPPRAAGPVAAGAEAGWPWLGHPPLSGTGQGPPTHIWGAAFCLGRCRNPLAGAGAFAGAGARAILRGRPKRDPPAFAAGAQSGTPLARNKAATQTEHCPGCGGARVGDGMKTKDGRWLDAKFAPATNAAAPQHVGRETATPPRVTVFPPLPFFLAPKMGKSCSRCFSPRGETILRNCFLCQLKSDEEKHDRTNDNYTPVGFLCLTRWLAPSRGNIIDWNQVQLLRNDAKVPLTAAPMTSPSVRAKLVGRRLIAPHGVWYSLETVAAVALINQNMLSPKQTRVARLTVHDHSKLLATTADINVAAGFHAVVAQREESATKRASPSTSNTATTKQMLSAIATEGVGGFDNFRLAAL